MALYKMSKKICESSLRWILNMRSCPAYRNGLRYTPEHYNLIEKQVSFDGHSGGSFIWCLRQNEYINQHSLDKWLTTENAYGYGHYLSTIKLLA